MAKYCVEDTTFSNIADAIREKTGDTAELTPLDMPAAIKGIETGGGSAELPEEAFKITGKCSYRFSNGGWDWFLENYGDKVTTDKITDADSMFNSCYAGEIPFDLNFDSNSYRSLQSMFFGASNLKQIGKIVNAYPSNMNGMFSGCKMLRELPEFVDLNMNRMHTYDYASLSSMFQACNSLRSIPEELLKELYNEAASSAYSTLFQSGFYDCYVLDEIRGLNPKMNSTMTSNIFSNTFMNCNRLKDLIFATQDDGTPYIVKWKSQTITLTSHIGYAMGDTYITGKNSGITADKEVTDDATYQALKNDADWWTKKEAYSRYNHDSAVNTINSLPDTSAYLATAGGTNTIKFLGISGELTDGGAINTLTEAEIAVAAAKGWTVSWI